MTPQVLTVGHSTHEVPEFLRLLHRHAVSALADVRSMPFSRFAPQYNRDALKRSATGSGLAYVFLGDELGARSRDPACYIDGRVQYARLAQTDTFKQGIERVVRGSESQPIAVMCTEKDPLDCHRTLLVARALVDRGVEVTHILADGQLESNEEAMDRLREKHGLLQPDLLRSPDELLQEALRRQEAQIAYVDEDLAALASEGT